jgi:hypothetical protein
MSWLGSVTTCRDVVRIANWMLFATLVIATNYNHFNSFEFALTVEFEFLRDQLVNSWTDVNSNLYSSAGVSCIFVLWLELSLRSHSNLSSYGRTAKELLISKSSVSVACALAGICVWTSRLPTKVIYSLPRESHLRNLAFETYHNKFMFIKC